MKKNKIPGIFRKQYKIKAFNSKILKRIHIPKDKEMLKNLFTENSSGKMEIIQVIPEEVLVRLKPLSKSIKKNKGMVSRWKTILVLFIVGSILIFNLFFKDRLLSKGVERGLESIFQADVDIEGLNFSLLKGKISYNSLIIADADNNIKNLMETGFSEFNIDMTELAKKRIKIEEMSLTGLKWNTPRIVQSDTDIDTDQLKTPAKKTSNSDNNFGGVLDVLSLSSDELDYKAILEQQKSNFNSLILIDQGNEQVDLLSKKWELAYLDKQQDIENLKDEVFSFESYSVQDIGSVEEGRSKIQELTSLKTRASEAKDDLLDLQREFQKDKESIIQLQKEIKAAIDDDYAYLDNLLDVSSGDMASLASGTAEKYIRNRWNSYYENALKALDVYKKFQDREAVQSQDNSGFKRFNGRNIPFPSPDNPVFLIEHILLSGSNEHTGKISSEISSISSEPDKITKPLTFLVNWMNVSNSLLLDGVLDFRSDSDLPFTMNIKSPGNSFILDEGIPFLNISSFNSVANIIGNSSSGSDKDTVLTSLDITLSDLYIEQKDTDTIVSRTIKDIFDELDQIDLKAEILVSTSGLESIKVRSSFDEILSEGISDYLDNMAGEIQSQLKESFTSYIDPFIKENAFLQSSLDTIGVESVDQISNVEDLENIIDNKKKDLENTARTIASEIEADAQKQLDEKEAQAQAEADKIQAEADAEAAKVQAEADKAKIEADKAKAEAEKKAEDEAAKLLDQAKDKIKIPGF